MSKSGMTTLTVGSAAVMALPVPEAVTAKAAPSPSPLGLSAGFLAIGGGALAAWRQERTSLGDDAAVPVLAPAPPPPDVVAVAPSRNLAMDTAEAGLSTPPPDAVAVAPSLNLATDTAEAGLSTTQSNAQAPDAPIAVAVAAPTATATGVFLAGTTDTSAPPATIGFKSAFQQVTRGEMGKRAFVKSRVRRLADKLGGAAAATAVGVAHKVDPDTDCASEAACLVELETADPFLVDMAKKGDF